jgi:glycosyltransferase involved in cell wall biosynthesis
MSDVATDDIRPRLILLRQFFDPEPTMKGAKFARRMSDLGFDVEVVTGFPNYPGGKVYEGYHIRPIKRETMDGVPVTRLALYPSHDSNRIGRILNYVSFFLSAAIYLTFFARRADVVYAYHPPLTVGMAAAVAGFLRRTPVVLDVQDMWPDTLRATGMIGSERVLRIVDAFCRWTWRRAAHVVVLSPGFRKLLIERGVPADRITVIPNWADEEAVAADPGAWPEAFGEPAGFRVLFAGNMGPAQALDSVLDAAAILAAKCPQVEFCFLGSGLHTQRLRERAERETLANVRFLPRVPMAQVGAYLAAVDCLLVHLKADPLFAITIPSKTQAYMAAGKPIVMAVEGDAAELVERSGGGVVVPPEDAEALAAAIAGLARMPPDDLARLGADARRFYDENLSFDNGTRRFAAVLNDASNRRKAA